MWCSHTGNFFQKCVKKNFLALRALGGRRRNPPDPPPTLGAIPLNRYSFLIVEGERERALRTRKSLCQWWTLCQCPPWRHTCTCIYIFLYIAICGWQWGWVREWRWWAECGSEGGERVLSWDLFQVGILESELAEEHQYLLFFSPSTNSSKPDFRMICEIQR